ncbi:MAG: CDP-alcohol phosphatidyltransferase family protein [Lacibacter sp.]
MKSRIPEALIYSRLFIGLLMIVLSSMHIPNYPVIAIILLTIGLLTDIFDGIVARQLNISTQKLRRLDSGIDQVFFTSVAVATFIHCPSFFTSNAPQLIILLCVEALTYLISFIKFRKEIATHSIGAKLWTLLLFATLVQITAQCQSTFLFSICFWAGIVTRMEIIAIILILKKWTNDVPTFYHSILLRKEKEIKRNKMFNG